jgi:hypothetical protein
MPSFPTVIPLAHWLPQATSILAKLDDEFVHVLLSYLPTGVPRWVACAATLMTAGQVYAIRVLGANGCVLAENFETSDSARR